MISILLKYQPFQRIAMDVVGPLQVRFKINIIP